MGKGSSGTNTVVQNTQPPAAVLAQYQNVINQANQVAQTPYTTGGFNASNLVAPFSDMQNTGFNVLNSTTGVQTPYYNQAQNDIQNSQTPIWNSAQQYSPSTMAQYANPYLNQAVGSTEAQIANTNAQQQQQVIGNAVASGAWGGDRSAIAQSELANQQDLAENSTISGMENTGFNQQQGEFNTQQAAQIGANEANAWLGSQGAALETGLGTTAQATGVNQANALLNAGAQQQALQQSELNIPYEQFQAQTAYPFQTTGWLSDISTGVGGSEGGTSSTTSPAPSQTSQILGDIGGAGLLGYEGLSAAASLGNYSSIGAMFAGMARGGIVPHYDNGGGIGGNVPYTPLSQIETPGVPQIMPVNIATQNLTQKGAMGVPKAPAPVSSQQTGPSLANIASAIKGGGGFGNNLGNAGFNSTTGLGTSTGAQLAALQNPDITQAFQNATAANAGTTFGTGGGGGWFSNWNRGGGIRPKHYDDGGAIGGLTPAQTGSNPLMGNLYSQYSNLPIEQLQQLAARQPQNPIIKAALQKKQMSGGTATQPQQGGIMAPQPQGILQQQGMKKGGGIQHLSGEDGDSVVDPISPSLAQADPSLQMPESVTVNAPPHVASDSDVSNDVAPPVALSRVPGGITPPPSPTTSPAPHAGGIVPAGLPDHDAFMKNYNAEVANAAPYNKPDPVLNFFGTLAHIGAGKSPQFGVNMAEGAEKGMQDIIEQKKEAAAESEKRGDLQAKGEDLYQRAVEAKQRMSIEQQQVTETGRHNLAEEAYQTSGLNKPEFDKLGNPWFRDPTSPTGWTKATGNIMGANQNSYGYEIGSIPEGTSAPVIDPKFDPTLTMTPTQKSIYTTKVLTQLEKDNQAAATNDDAINRLKSAKEVANNTTTGGITNMLGIGAVADAFSTQRQELNSLNKELALSPGERPSGMRITQGEVMMLRQAQPGTMNSPDANKDIAEAMIAIRQRPSEFANFKNDFIANNGYWDDAIGQQMYNTYIKSNPIIQQDKAGKISLNPNREPIEQFANNGGFARWGVKGNPQSNTSSTTSNGPGTPGGEVPLMPLGAVSIAGTSGGKKVYNMSDGTQKMEP